MPVTGLHLRAYLKRRTLISLLNFYRSIRSKFMASQSLSNPQPSDDHQFDPSQPSIPISYPIKTLQDLESRAYLTSFHYPFNKASVPLSGSKTAMPDRPRLLVCHDMAGGYTDDDKWIQGGSNSDSYSIWHWYLMDVFVYFSHSLVTLPPPGWVNAAHKHGVKVLGTFITESDEGRKICNKLLSSKDYAHLCAERLTELAISLGFDGWLLNMEVDLDIAQIPNLQEFVGHLTHTMHLLKPGSLVIWYDSVTVTGDLDWQDQLNAKNKPFFDLCDGIFTNYTWKENYPKLSANFAGDRKFDVYVGIDVFGRKTYGGGQWDTNVALNVIKEANVSAAIFAPGWVYETKQPPDFQTAQNRWWALVEKSWGLMQYYPSVIPFYSNFDQGRGHHFSVAGRKISNADWCNLSCQSFQPYLEFDEHPEFDAIHVLVNPTEESYNGGGNITFRGDLLHHAHVTKRLFQAQLLLGDPTVHFSYSVKSDGESLIGLSLRLTSVEGESVSALLASHGNTLLTMNQFSSKFSQVIMPHRVTKLDSAEGWVLLEASIAMPGHTLTEIGAVCYKLEPSSSETHLNLGIDKKKKTKYYAVLGHLLIQTPGHDVIFPSSSSWQVEGQSINWVAGSGQSKYVSLKILWRLKDGNDLSKFQKYHVYAEKIYDDGNMAEKIIGVQEFLGVALVEPFYVSDLPVPSGTYAIKFFIQVWGIDGTCQQLVDSPSLQLDVEG